MSVHFKPFGLQQSKRPTQQPDVLEDPAAENNPIHTPILAR